MAPPPPPAGTSMSFTKSRRLMQYITHEISVTDKFPLGYRNREDITNLPAGVLVVGSQNMLVNTSARIQVRNGYTIDGSQLLYIQTTTISSNEVTLDSTVSLNTGNYVQVVFTGTSITGLTSGSYYYAIVVDSTHVQFATSNANAIAGTAITISGTPTGASLSLQKSSVSAPILSSFDWNSMGNSEIHMKVGFLDSTGSDGRLQFRWVDSNNNVWWSDLLTGLTSVNYNFTTFWDTTETIRECLFVNGTSNVYEWSGAYDTVASVTANTIVLTHPVATTGFYTATGAKQIVILRGVSYTYTYSAGSPNTLTITAGGNPSTGAHTAYAGDIVAQAVVTTANSSITALPATFANGLISTLNNQIFYGSLTSSSLYMSKINNYLDCSFTAGTRLPGEGATANLDDNIVAFVPQESVMYVSAGRNFWYNTTLVQSTSYNGTISLVSESFTVALLKTNPQQAAQSQALTSKMQNYVTMVSNEPTLDKLGRLEDILGTPQTQNISDSIKLDFDTYNFANGSIFYWRWYLLVSIPTLGIIRMYNFNTKAWECPQTLPITRFYTVKGALYGHSSVTSESYQLFTGYSDRAILTAEGAPYLAIANFSYQNFGLRPVLKNQNKFYVEGYISANTTMNCVINNDLDGNLTQQTFTILGDDSTIAGISQNSNSIGAQNLGKMGLGTQSSLSLTGLPPKFRVIKTFPRYDFYECQFSFSILGVDQNFQLLAFGSNAAPSDTTNAQIEE